MKKIMHKLDEHWEAHEDEYLHLGLLCATLWMMVVAMAPLLKY